MKLVYWIHSVGKFFVKKLLRRTFLIFLLTVLSILDTQVKIKLGHIYKTLSVKRKIEKGNFPPLCYCKAIEFNLLIQHYFTVLFSLAAKKIETTTLAVEN